MKTEGSGELSENKLIRSPHRNLEQYLTSLVLLRIPLGPLHRLISVLVIGFRSYNTFKISSTKTIKSLGQWRFTLCSIFKENFTKKKR